MVTDRVLQEAGVVKQVTAAIDRTDAELFVYDDGEIEPSTNNVKSAAEVAKEFSPDLFVAVGGGSNMDLAKVCRIVASHGCDAESLLGFDQVPRPRSNTQSPALVCLPTTAGTGSEVTHSAVLKSSSTGKKSAVLSQYIRADVAVVDPYLMVTCPPRLTAESGIAALTHAIEAYLVANFYSFAEDRQSSLPYEGNNPFGDMLAEKAIHLIGRNLPRVFEEPEDLGARSGMAFAATLAGAAFANCGVSLCHALEYPIGSKYGCTHGVGKGIVLPEVIRFWSETRGNRVARIGAMLGVADAHLMPPQEATDATVENIQQLRKAIELPESLTEFGASSNDVGELATSAMSLQRLVDLSPTTPTTADLETILNRCM